MSHSGGSVNFTGPYGDVYMVSYSAPTFTPPSGATLYSVNITSAGPSEVGCGGVQASQTYQATYRIDAGVYTTESATVTGYSGACPAPTYPPSWIDNTIGPFVASVAYSDSVSASNMNYSGSYSVSSGSLPSGISFSAGSFSGTPTTAGQSYSFTIAASNSYNTITQSFSGTVGAAPTAGKLKVWNGSAWVYGPAKVWTGTAWVDGVTKIWNGTTWVTSI
jgi:hypothetical protein